MKISRVSLVNDDSMLLKNINKGDLYSVRFKFKCNLLMGNYYTNCGVFGFVDDRRLPLNRIVDALLFKVLPDEKRNYITGIVNLEQGVEIIKTV